MYKRSEAWSPIESYGLRLLSTANPPIGGQTMMMKRKNIQTNKKKETKINKGFVCNQINIISKKLKIRLIRLLIDKILLISSLVSYISKLHY